MQGQVDQAFCHNMYPREIDTGNGTQNLNLSLNWALPPSAATAREMTMRSPRDFIYTVDITHNHAVAWLRERERAKDSDRPFFLYVAFTVPHAGGWGHAPDSPTQGAPVPSDEPYGQRTWPEVERDHAAVVTYMDSKVGSLMAELELLKLDNATLVVFARDPCHTSGPQSST